MENFNKLVNIYTYNEIGSPMVFLNNQKANSAINDFGFYADGRQLPKRIYKTDAFGSGLLEQKKNDIIWIYVEYMRKFSEYDMYLINEKYHNTLETFLITYIKRWFGFLNAKDYKKFYDRVGRPVIDGLIDKPPGWEFLTGSKQ